VGRKTEDEDTCCLSGVRGFVQRRRRPLVQTQALGSGGKRHCLVGLGIDAQHASARMKWARLTRHFLEPWVTAGTETEDRS